VRLRFARSEPAREARSAGAARAKERQEANEVMGTDWKTKTIVVTGATSGIGRATAVGLAQLDSRLILVGRDAGRAEETIAEIRKATGRKDVEVVRGDFARQAEVRRVADEILARTEAIHVLVNNAGVTMLKRTTTPDGYETTFAVNHLAYFLLTGLLLPRLLAAAPGARIVNVASDAHRWGALDFGDLQNEREYKAMKVYGQSKTANILFTRELAKRLEGSGVTVNALHPGAVATRLGRGSGPLFDLLQRVIGVFMKSPEQGAETSLHLATAPELATVSGRYFADKKEKPVRPHASDDATATRLWEISEGLTGVRYP
jgi:NAD(P)-dependent dehydrogenase (short-subunit alcohol dehydrogenase family)